MAAVMRKMQEDVAAAMRGEGLVPIDTLAPRAFAAPPRAQAPRGLTHRVHLLLGELRRCVWSAVISKIQVASRILAVIDARKNLIVRNVTVDV